MSFERIPWPPRRGPIERPGVDPDILAALLETAVTGGAIRVPVWMMDPLRGASYLQGYAFHKRDLGEGFIAARVRRDSVTCDVCQTEVDVVTYVSQSGVRLRRRDECPQPGCSTGRVTARRRAEP